MILTRAAGPTTALKLQYLTIEGSHKNAEKVPNWRLFDFFSPPPSLQSDMQFCIWRVPLNGGSLRNCWVGWEQRPQWRQVSWQVFQQFVSTLFQILYQISLVGPCRGRLGPAVSALARCWLVTAAVVRGEERWDRESSSTNTSRHSLWSCDTLAPRVTTI